MSKFEILSDIAVPAAAARVRPRGEFAEAVDSLEIGQGFYFEAKGTLKSQYPKVSPKKFGGVKRFKIFQAVDASGALIDGKYGVKRIADSTGETEVPEGSDE